MPLTTIPSSPLLATASSPGAMPATDKSKLDAMAPGGWLDQFALAVPTVAPGCAGDTIGHIRFQRAADLVTGISAATDERGGVGVIGNGGSWLTISGTVIDAYGGAPWAFGCRAKVPQPANLKACGFGLEPGGGYSVTFNVDYSVSQSQIYLSTYDASQAGGENTLCGTFDSSTFHTYMFGWDGTRIRVSIDGAIVASFIPTANKFPGAIRGAVAVRGDDGYGLKIKDIAYAV